MLDDLIFTILMLILPAILWIVPKTRRNNGNWLIAWKTVPLGFIAICWTGWLMSKFQSVLCERLEKDIDIPFWVTLVVPLTVAFLVIIPGGLFIRRKFGTEKKYNPGPSILIFLAAVPHVIILSWILSFVCDLGADDYKGEWRTAWLPKEGNTAIAFQEQPIHPFLAEYGGFDVDTLLHSTNCRIPVIRPVEQMIDHAFSNNPRGDLSVAILCDPQYGQTGIYEKIFARKAAAQGLKGATCVVSTVSRRDSVLHTFLRDYLAAGQTKPLDAILVDELSVDTDSLKVELAEIVSVMNESSMTIGKLIPRDFFLLSSFDEVSDCCYSFLREHNLFTHNIAKPQVSIYRPVRKPESEDDSIILIPGSYVQN